ncbi:hypothetical protein [Frankia sp. AiPs1]
MIPAHGWHAFYQTTRVDSSGKERKVEIEKVVVAWNDEGVPLVVDESTGNLVPAASAGKLTAVIQAGYTHVLPGGGWMAEYREDNGILVRYPIVAWQVHSNTGLVEPVTVDNDGYSETDIKSTGNFVRLWHPDWPRLDPRDQPKGT